MSKLADVDTKVRANMVIAIDDCSKCSDHASDRKGIRIRYPLS